MGGFPCRNLAAGSGFRSPRRPNVSSGLEGRGIVAGYRAVIDPAAVGLGMMACRPAADDPTGIYAPA